MATTQIRGAQILDLTITSADLAADSVITSKILDANVTLAKLAANSVDSSKIVDGSIVAADLASDSVTTVKILDANVTLAKLASNSVDSSKIVDGSIVAADLASDSVTTAKIVDGAVTVAKFSDFRVTDNNVVAGTTQTVAVTAGTIRDNVTVTPVGATAALSLTNGVTNFVEVTSGGVVQAVTGSYTSGNVPIARVAVSAAPTQDITAITDDRAWLLVDQAPGISSVQHGTAHVVREVPTGTINGVTVAFTLAATPISGKEEVYLNGLLQNVGGANDYTISGATITFNTAPATGDVLLVSYVQSV